jgi:hypothetical protein
MNKKLLTMTLASIVFMGTVHASNTELLEEFCDEINTNRKISKIAVANNGRYKVETTRIYSGRHKRKSKNKSYRGCRYDTPWIQDAHELLCDEKKVTTANITRNDINKIQTPKNIMFFFDGAGDFDASYANARVNPINIDGTEGEDLGMGTVNGLHALEVMFYRYGHSLNKERDNIELHYHASSGFSRRENYSSVIKCAEQSKYYLDVLGTLGHKQASPKWLVMGYSNGGELTIDFQNDIADQGVSVDLALAIDPIVQTLKYPTHGLKEYIGEKNEKTKRLVSIYQDSDYGSMPYLELRGKPVFNADVNLLMEADKHHDLDVGGRSNHVRIVETDFVFDVTNCEFEKVFNSYSTCEY